MTIDADQATLLVDVRRQVVILHSIGPGWSACGRERGPILAVIVVFIPTMVVAAHGIAVVTAQALGIRGFEKIVGRQLAVLEGQMAGAAPCTMGDGRVGVAS